MTFTPDTTIYEWTFEFYSPTEEEWLDFGYWTLEDNRQFITETLIQDEDGNVEDLSVSVKEWTFEEFQQNQGPDCLSLLRDYDG